MSAGRVTPRLRAAMLARVAFAEASPWVKRRERRALAAADSAARATLTAEERDAVTAIIAQRMFDRMLGRPLTAVPEVSL